MAKTIYIIETGGYLVPLPDGRSPRFESADEARKAAAKFNRKGDIERYRVVPYQQNPDVPTVTVKTVKSGKSARYALAWRVGGSTSYQSNLTGRRLLDELDKGRRELPGLEVKYENSRRVRNGALAFAKESQRDTVSRMLARHKTPAVKGRRVYLAKLGSQDTRYIKGGARYLIVGEGIPQKDMADWWRQAVEKSHGEPDGKKRKA